MINSLVIKPTELCNFKCTFCSSTSISDDQADILNLEDIKRFLRRYPTTERIIVNGGDPLMVPPEYYWELLDFIDTNNHIATIGITSNLWAFYKKPDRWTELFRHPKFGVMTSFQYGDKRLKGDLTPFTETEFWAISDMMLERVGYRPDFISVTDYDNEDDVIRTVELAKAMGVECKVGYMMASGPAVEYKTVIMGSEHELYLLADMYEKYIAIYKAGLSQWEHHTKQMMKRLRGEPTICPQSRTCDSGIRTMQPSGRYYSCPALADDDVHRIDFDEEMTGATQTPLQHDPEMVSMKMGCFTCPLFDICNGCKKTISDHKRLGLVEKHCRKMKTLASDIIEANGLSGHLIPTPYYNEDSPMIITVG